MDLILEYLPSFLTFVAVVLSCLLRRPLSKDLQEKLSQVLKDSQPLLQEKGSQCSVSAPVEKVVDFENKMVFNGSPADLLKSYETLIDIFYQKLSPLDFERCMDCFWEWKKSALEKKDGN